MGGGRSDDFPQKIIEQFSHEQQVPVLEKDWVPIPVGRVSSAVIGISCLMLVKLINSPYSIDNEKRRYK